MKQDYEDEMTLEQFADAISGMQNLTITVGHDGSLTFDPGYDECYRIVPSKGGGREDGTSTDHAVLLAYRFDQADVTDQARGSRAKEVSESARALAMIREATELALDDAGIVEAVAVLISQRNNARHYAETFRAKLKELGHEFI